MTNPTSNFGWQMPTSTDLVTDLPADFEVFGQAVDTSLADLKGGTTGQVLAKASNANMDFVWSNDASGMTNPMTTTGDIIYSSSGSTPARLGIGSTGQVLNVNAGVPAWTTISAGTDNYSLVNAGGTALSGSTTVTVSGITDANSILVVFTGAKINNAGNVIDFRINADSGTNYDTRANQTIETGSTYDPASFTFSGGTDDDRIVIAKTAGSVNGVASGFVRIDGAKSSGVKPYYYSGGGNAISTWFNASYTGAGIYNSSSTISSISLISRNGLAFNAGTIYVYKTS